MKCTLSHTQLHSYPVPAALQLPSADAKTALICMGGGVLFEFDATASVVCLILKPSLAVGLCILRYVGDLNLF